MDSKAADLRVRLDLLLGEHVIVIAKDSLAATANRADEYAGYATLLTVNGNDLTLVHMQNHGYVRVKRMCGDFRLSCQGLPVAAACAQYADG